MKIITIIVTFNAEKWLDCCISSVANSSIPIDIMVIDNQSNDSTCNIIKSKYPFVKLVESESNLGFGKANNIGLQYAIDNDYDYIYLLNQDAWVKENTIENLISIQKCNKKYGILSPFQCQANLKHLDFNFARDTCSWQSNDNLLDDLYFNSIDEVYEVKRVMAAHWLISRECLLKVGGFSPSFPHYGEDYNYCERVQFHGFSVGICPSCRAVHDREFRIESINKIRYIHGYIKPIRILSNINANNKIKELCEAFVVLLFKYHTIISLSQFIKLIFSYKKILLNRKISEKECAFLNKKY